MSAYVIVQVEITDRERFSEYLKETPGTIAQFGGKYIARAGETVVLEGEDKGKRVVIIEFPSFDKAEEWYSSAEYRKVKKLRDGAAIGTITLVNGC